MGERLLAAAAVALASLCEILDVVSKIFYDKLSSG